MSYYQYIDGVRYTRDLLEEARKATTGRGEGRLSYDEIREIYRLAEDGLRITDTERRTLIYIAEHFNLTEKAREWLAGKLGPSPDANGLESVIRRVIREEYHLSGMRWRIAEDEVRRQERRGDHRARLFESALRGAIDSYLFRSRDQLSFGAFVNWHSMGRYPYPLSGTDRKQILNRSTLFLVPAAPPAQNEFVHDLPNDPDFDRYWIFILEIPEFFPALFTAFVDRNRPLQFSSGFITTLLPLEVLANGIVRKLLGFDNLQWKLDALRIEEQMEFAPWQNFGNSFFAALNGAIFNGESSFSLRDFIRDEIWPDPERKLDDYMREYINSGTIYLLPDTEQFPVAESYTPWYEGEWYFGLEMPERTEVQFVVNVPREIQDGITGWNDGFVPPDSRDLSVRLEEVIAQFGVSGLRLIFSGEEFEKQRKTHGPDWARPTALLRLALNTILDDYVTEFSVFNLVALRHKEEIDPVEFENVFAYRRKIREQTKQYLKTAELELLPMGYPDNNPINGEEIEVNWLVFVHLPDLQRGGFWVIIPRFPEEEQIPYVYGEF